MTHEIETKNFDSQSDQQLKITSDKGRTTIIFRKAILKGKTNQAEVLDTLLIAAKMQAEYYIKKLSLGAPLDPSEVKCLKELAEITKLEVTPKEEASILPKTSAVEVETVKSSLYAALAEKLDKSSK